MIKKPEDMTTDELLKALKEAKTREEWEEIRQAMKVRERKLFRELFTKENYKFKKSYEAAGPIKQFFLRIWSVMFRAAFHEEIEELEKERQGEVQRLMGRGD